MAVTVKFLADIANWVAGLGKSEDAVDDNTTALEDLMAQAIKLGVQTGRTTDEIARDFSQAYGVPLDRAQRAVQEVTGELDDLGDAAQDAGKKTENGLGDASTGVSKLEGAANKAGGGLSELGSIAKDVLSGDIASGAEGAIGVLSNLAGAVPVVGGALVGLGAIAGVFAAEWKRSAEETEKRIQAMYDDMLSSGNNYLSAQFVQKAIGEITADQGKYNEALAKSKEIGVGVNDVIRAMAGDQASINALLDEQNAKRSADIDAIRASGESLSDQQAKIDGVNAKYATQNGLLLDLARAQDSAGQRFSAYQSATNDYLQGLITSAGTASLEVDELGNKLYTLPDDTKILVSADTGAATTNVATFKGDLDGVPETVNTTVRATVDDSAVKAWRPPTFFSSVKVNVVGPTAGEYRFQQ